MPTPPDNDADTRPRLSIQRLALLFVGVVFVSILALDVWQAWTARREALRNSEVAVSNLARSLAQHAGDTVKEADTVLVGLVERVETEGFGAPQLARLNALMKSDVAFLEQLHGLFLYDKDGNWLVTSSDSIPAGANNSDREYFTFHRNNPDRGAHIGPVIRSRSTGDLIIPVSRRIDAADGSFAGVVLATLNVEYFRLFYEGFDIDHKGVIVLTLNNGTILVRRPFDSSVIGTSLAKGKVFSELLPRAHTGTAMFRSIIDNVERLYGYEALNEYPLVVEAGPSREAVLASWREGMIRSAVIVALVLLAMALFGVALLRQIRRGMRTEAQLREAHDALHKLALEDPLTGLANRRRLDDALPHEIARSRRSGRPLGLIMLDIDHFKRYNDRYGHPAGDGCIQAVAEAVRASVNRVADLVVRYGGEEIFVLLPEVDAQGTCRVAERILANVRALAIEHADNPQGIVTLSAGVHSWQPDGREVGARELVQAADRALYAAKGAGRNRVSAEPA
jgi:diguanylate cyclase (GGDEF)-like protein